MCDFYIFLERKRERERRGCGSGRRDMKKQEVCFSTLSSLTHEEIQKETFYHGVFSQSPFRAKSVHSAATFVIPPGMQDQSGVPTRLLILHLKNIYFFRKIKCILFPWESNPHPLRCLSNALPLSHRNTYVVIVTL